MRKIPATMVSQHPDHGAKPYWQKDPFITTRQETEECFLSYFDLGATEYKWDWEGKFVDESVLERLLGEHLETFQKSPLGVEKFLTFRLPNPNVETEFRLGRAFMGILSAAGLAKQVGLHSPPIFEVIIPMVESAEEMIDIEEAFDELANLKHRLYKLGTGTLRHIEVIPLFEQVQTIIHSDKILEKYLRYHIKKFGKKPLYLRPYVARSDPALNSGIVPTVLAIKIALSKYRTMAKQEKMPLYPIIGTGSLPFRGGLNPETITEIIREYAGIRTVVVQSAFRYDYPKEKVRQAIYRLEKELPLHQAVTIGKEEEKELQKIIHTFERFYKPTIEQLAPMINQVSKHLPKRRERVQHIGLFGYSRGVGKVKLPRAIAFTAALYSMGVPPELIGTGRGLREIMRQGKTKLLEKYYVNLRQDLLRAGRFLNKEVLAQLAQNDKAWLPMIEDVQSVEEYLQVPLGPQTKEAQEHQKITAQIYQKMKKGLSPTALIEKAAVVRKSLG